MLLHVFLNHLNFSLQILLGVLAPLFSKNVVIFRVWNQVQVFWYQNVKTWNSFIKVGNSVNNYNFNWWKNSKKVLTLDSLNILESFDNIFEQYWISNYALQLTLKHQLTQAYIKSYMNLKSSETELNKLLVGCPFEIPNIRID